MIVPFIFKKKCVKKNYIKKNNNEVLIYTVDCTADVIKLTVVPKKKN